MTERTLIGYRHWPGSTCPFCRGSYMTVSDDGDPDTFKVRCWCGSAARVRRDDADIVEALAAGELPILEEIGSTLEDTTT